MAQTIAPHLRPCTRCSLVTCRLLAPFAPFLTDWIHTELAGDSVHLAKYARDDVDPRDTGLEQAMEHVRMLATLGRAAREDAGVRVRQPLQRMVCVVPAAGIQGSNEDRKAIEELIPLLAGELNLKEIGFLSSADALVSLEAKAEFQIPREEIRKADTCGCGCSRRAGK